MLRTLGWYSRPAGGAISSRPTAVLWATTERGSPTEIEPGVYEYTYALDLEAAAAQLPAINTPAAQAILPTVDVSYQPALVHRVSVSHRDSNSRYNAVVDFVPNDLPSLRPTLANQVVTNESCGGCHGASSDRSILAFPNVHGNTRFDVNFCVTCHNPNFYDGYQSTDTEWATLDLVTLVHKLHSDSGDYSASNRDYGHVHYPQPISNCLTCHDNNRMPKPAGRAAADAVAFQTRPSVDACGTCHNVDFVAGTFNHNFGDQPADVCTLCHGPGAFASVDRFHISNASTPNNPLQPAGLVQFEYQIASVTLNASNQPIVTFRLLANGTPVNLQSLPTGVGLGNMRFYASWSAPLPGGAQMSDGPAIAAPQDFNNLVNTLPVTPGSGRLWWDLGTSQGVRSWDQPQALGNLSSFVGTLTPAADGYFVTAPGITATPFAFPPDATLTAIGIEGRPQSQGVSIDTSAKIAYAGTPRRMVVSEANCLACHETLAFHGGSRVNAPNYCLTCHNPENSSSNIFSGVIPSGLNGAGMSIHGQLPMNLKDLVHGLHAGKPVGGDPIRTVPFSFIRGTVAGGSGQGPYDFSDIGFPAALSDCETCHVPGSYALPLNANAAWSVVNGFPAATATAPHNPGLATRMAPASASCYGCHNTPAAKAHFEVNTSFGSGLEACAICHGPGKIVPAHVD